MVTLGGVRSNGGFDILRPKCQFSPRPGTQQFHATVTGTTNTPVVWSA